MDNPNILFITHVTVYLSPKYILFHNILISHMGLFVQCHYLRWILSLMGQKTASWCLTSFQFLAYDTSELIKVHVVFIFLPKIVHWNDQNFTLNLSGKWHDVRHHKWAIKLRIGLIDTR